MPARVLLLVALGAAASTLGAQAVRTPDDEARTLPAGVIRLGIGDDNSRIDEFWAPGGTLTNRGAPLTFDTLGVAQVPVFAPAQTGIRNLLSDQSFKLDFGKVNTSASLRTETYPISLEAGIFKRLTFRARLPIVHTRQTIATNVNPTRFEGNVAFNPALAGGGALAADAGVYAQFIAASRTLSQILTNCANNPSAPHCASINSDRATLQGLVTAGNQFASGVAQVYGGPNGAGALVVPVAGSNTQARINSRDSSLTAQFNSAFATVGLPALNTVQPIAAPARAGLGALDTLFTDTTYGLAVDSLKDVDKYGIGDAELSATLLLLDTFGSRDSTRMHPRGFNFRTSVTGLFRLGTGTPPAENQLLDPGTGTGENAVEIHSATDILLGQRLWISGIVRATYQLSDNVVSRIPGTAGEVLDPLYSRTTITRQLGDKIEMQIDPHYAINDYFALNGTYLFRHHLADKYSGVFNLDSAQTGIGPVHLNASILGANTEYTSHTFGFGLTFSTLAAAALRKHIVLPLDITYEHDEVLSATGGYANKVIFDTIRMRLYMRPFGGHGYAF
ncbi:MAG TPA: hypothetical protein VFA43_02190 [Gemmatimonadaceae bacterium]|nr:hypothetical protein [Gemmatimonadaceae bacterium]